MLLNLHKDHNKQTHMSAQKLNVSSSPPLTVSLPLPLSLQLLRGVTISQGGVLPHIPEVLLFKKSQLRGLSKPHALPAKTTPAMTKKPELKVCIQISGSLQEFSD